MSELITIEKDGVIIQAWQNDDKSIDLSKKMSVSFDLPDGTLYKTEAYPEDGKRRNVGTIYDQIAFAKALKKLKWAVRHGGSRPGAGRKPKGSANKIPVTFTLDPEVVEVIRSQPNQAEFIEAAVREKIKAL